MSSPILILLTHQFPYGKGETFLETEIKTYYSFKKVIIVPLNTGLRGGPRKILHNSVIEKLKSKNANHIRDGLRFNIIQESIFLIKNKRYSNMRFSKALDWNNRAKLYMESIKRILKKHGVEKQDSVVFYSYWSDEGALAACYLKNEYKNSIAVARCHGFDLYEERSAYKYLPFRKYLLENLSMICPISQAGAIYLKEKYRIKEANIVISRLGTELGLMECENNIEINNVLKIVSCSNLIPLKRVDKIIDVLQCIHDIQIEWTHFGSGVQEKQIQRACETKLGSNIKWVLMGHVENKEILKRYAQDGYHVLLHVSETEGIPVSFMEAMSYGIPVVSTNVGGVAEIVSDGNNGYLIPKDFKIEQVTDILRNLYNMEENKYLMLRECAKRTWLKRYNGAKNYKKFMRELNMQIKLTY